MIVVIDYDMGNVGSVLNMIKKVGGEAIVSSDKSAIMAADKLILPGVGSFDQGVKNLQRFDLSKTLEKKVLKEKIPILGICLGLQLFTQESEEGTSKGLGWINAKTIRFRTDDLKIPHMGWDYIKIRRNSPLLDGLSERSRFYFTHSYHIICKNENDILATTRYGYEFASVIEKDNIYGTQFHPEKSHLFGMRLIRNFVEMNTAKNVSS